MPNIIIKDKEIAVPGETIATGMDMLPGNGTYRNGEKIISNRLGVVGVDSRTVRILPLSGSYNPKTNDTIIGKVIDVGLYGWRLDTNSAYSAMMYLKDGTSEFVVRGADLTQFYKLGEYVVCNITNVTTQKLVDVTTKGPGLRKLNGGRIISVDPNKVPRIIGKQGSMVSMLKTLTKCNIIVGQNGIVWIDGEPVNELKATQAIRKIEKESHTTGLTDKIKEFLEKG